MHETNILLILLIMLIIDIIYIISILPYYTLHTYEKNVFFNSAFDFLFYISVILNLGVTRF